MATGTPASVMTASWGRSQHRKAMLPSAIPGPMNPAGSVSDPGPGQQTGLTVEIYVNSAWTDISAYVYYRNMVRISRGRQDETSQVQPQTCTMTLNNRDGRFSPRNPTGPYFGSIGRNTPIRVSRLQNGVRRYRFHGEVTAWPTNTDISGTDVYVDISAAGMLRRLRQGTPPALSDLYRAFTLTNAVPNVVAYWPCEDGGSSTGITSGLPGGQPMTFTGTPTFASDSSFAASSPIPVLNSSSWTAPVPFSGTWTDNVVRFLMHVPSGGDTDGGVVARFFTAGTVARADLVYNSAFGGELTMNGYDAFGNSLFSLGPFVPSAGTGAYNGQLFRVGFELRTSGSGVEYSYQSYRIVTPTDGTGAGPSGTLSSSSVGAITGVVINPNSNMVGTSIGHISVQNVWDSLFDILPPLVANWQEGRRGRFTRLCLENGVNAVAVFPTPDNEFTLLGYQLPDTFPNLLQQVPESDLGMMYETRDQLALAYRTRDTLYNQGTSYNNVGSVLTLDYSQHNLSAPAVPVDDDAYTRNDVTVTRIGGSSARQQLTSGALSVQPPPNGVGPYDTAVSISLDLDSNLADQAGWRLHLGTVDEPRYPAISLDLRHSTFTGSVDTMNAAMVLEIGDRVVVNNPPAWLPPQFLSLLVQGYQESIGIFEHDMVLNCSPERPYEVAQLEDVTLSVADTDGSTLTGDLSSTGTLVQFSTSGSSSPVWTTSVADFPFDVSVGGEQVAVVSPGTGRNPNPLLLQGISTYTGENATISMDSTTPWVVNRTVPSSFYGSATLLVAPTGGFSFADVTTGLTPAGSISVGTTYEARAWVYSLTGRTYQMFINWWTSGAGFISTSFGSSTAVPSGVWTLVSVTATAPATTSRFSIGVTDGNSPTSDQTFNVFGVNACANSSLTQPSSPQTFTVVRSINGVVKAQTAGTDVRLLQPMTLAL